MNKDQLETILNGARSRAKQSGGLIITTVDYDDLCSLVEEVRKQWRQVGALRAMLREAGVHRASAAAIAIATADAKERPYSMAIPKPGEAGDWQQCVKCSSWRQTVDVLPVSQIKDTVLYYDSNGTERDRAGQCTDGDRHAWKKIEPPKWWTDRPNDGGDEPRSSD